MLVESLPIDAKTLLQKCTSLLKQTLGKNVEVVAYTIVTRKDDYAVIIAQSGHPSLDIVLKLAGPNATMACPFEQSAYLHRLVAKRTNILMPEVLAADTTCQRWPWRYLIRTKVAGIEWAKVRNQLTFAEAADLLTQFGDAVAQIHNISMPTFGELASSGEICQGLPYVEALRRRAKMTISSKALCALFHSLLERNRDLFTDVKEATLCHEDLHWHNLLLRKDDDRWKLATILDFDKAWAGSPDSDLARLELWDGMTSDSFWHAYRERRKLSALYEQRRPILQLLWCFEYAQQTQKHLGDTNRLCDTVGLPRLEQFV